VTPRLWLIAAAVVAVLLGAGAIYLEGRSAGGNAARVDQLEQTNETQRSITDADAHGPRTPDDVDRRLRDGSF
jgi:membrane protein DedA with SNARE-associated domain